MRERLAVVAVIGAFAYGVLLLFGLIMSGDPLVRVYGFLSAAAAYLSQVIDAYRLLVGSVERYMTGLQLVFNVVSLGCAAAGIVTLIERL